MELKAFAQWREAWRQRAVITANSCSDIGVFGKDRGQGVLKPMRENVGQGRAAGIIS